MQALNCRAIVFATLFVVTVVAGTPGTAVGQLACPPPTASSRAVLGTESPASDSASAYRAALVALDQVLDGIGQLRGKIDRAQFDIAALEKQLGFEPEDLSAFVREQIAFEQYAGLLRGPRGTLMSRAGNALDQAVLLSTLIEDAGYETRIASATLDASQAQSLFAQMAAPRPPPPPVGDVEAMKALLVCLAKLTGKAEAEVEQALEPAAIETTDLYQAAEADAGFIREVLTRERITLGEPGLEAVILNEARDYFWLEYRLVPADPWLPVHPAFADPKASPQVTAKEFFSSDAVPDALKHRFRARVVNEQLLAGEPKTYEVMGWWERPAAELVGTPLTYYNYPSGLSDPKDLLNLPALYEKTGVYIPTFNDRMAEGGRGFDRDGETYGVKILAAGQLEAERTGKTVSRTLGKFGVTMDGLEGETPGPPQTQGPTLTGQWIEYALIAPGGSETVIRRSVLDRIDAEARAAGRFDQVDDRSSAEIGEALTRQHTFMLATGRYPESYVLDRTLERILGVRPMLEIALHTSYFSDEEIASPRTRGETAWLGHLMLYAAFDMGVADGPVYRPEPSLMVYQRPLGSPPKARLSLDIVNNTRRAFRVTDGMLVAAPIDLVRAGVWETYAESLLPADLPPGSEPVMRYNTMEILRRARDASIDLRVLRATDPASLSELSLPGEAKIAIRNDLDAGFVVVVPESLPAGMPMAGWWRIDPATGETLGMAADGRGAELVEYLVINSINLAFTADSCFGEGSGVCSCILGVIFAVGGLTSLPSAAWAMSKQFPFNFLVTNILLPPAVCPG